MTETDTSAAARAGRYFGAQLTDLHVRTDRMFAVLMGLQWVGGIVAAATLSPRTWTGSVSAGHIHLWAAVVVGGALALYPMFLVIRRPGTALTRHVIAVSQMLTSALLIHLSGGRIETHFHVFGSLAFLAFYRDRSVLTWAAAVIIVDHLVRGIFWPTSVYGVASASLWRTLEHGGWVLFELTFLMIATNKSRREMWTIADRQAKMDAAHHAVELQVLERTSELRRAEQRTRAIFETAADGILTVDTRGEVCASNPAAEEIFGCGDANLVGRDIATLVSAEDVEAWLAAASGDDTGGIRREATGRRPDGTSFPLDLAVSKGHDGLCTAIVRDITERKSVDRMKTEFVSTVSHELRTPLTSIRGSLGLLAGGVGGELGDKARSLVEIATNNSDRLVRLVNDILDIEKIESGKIELDLRRLDLVELVEEAVAANDAYARALEVEIAVERADRGAIVLADSDRILQVLTNLISNAAKFSPQGDSVRLSVHSEGPWVTVRVSDRGPGIPAEFRARIFEKFAQADASDVRQKGGTGLGLSISRAIVELHGGRIDFETAEGEGTTFWFRLAAAPQASPSPAAPPPSDRVDSRPRVLVCEDDPDIAKLLSLMLETAGTAVDVAAHAAQARDLLAAGSYDAMTLDLQLPGESGLDLLRDLRSQTATAELPVVVVSARAGEGRRELDAEALGVISWIGKPIDQDRLLDSVRAAVRRRDSAGNVTAPRVLHVEDNEDLASIVAETLRSTAAELHHARDLTAARDLLERHEFDVVLLDLELPDGSGLELVPLLGRRGIGVPVVIFSASEPAADVTGVVAASLVKSRTSNEELIDTITSVVRGGPEVPVGETT